jgi:hypothetical protein
MYYFSDRQYNYLFMTNRKPRWSISSTAFNTHLCLWKYKPSLFKASVIAVLNKFVHTVEVAIANKSSRKAVIKYSPILL